MSLELNLLPPATALETAHRKLNLQRSEVQRFQGCLGAFVSGIDDAETEEHAKNRLRTFLNDAFYKERHDINTKGRTDLVIHNGPTSDTRARVLIETKSPGNSNEMISAANPNRKALHELLLYYLREVHDENNIVLARLIVSNAHEWFIFDAAEFDALCRDDKKVLSEFKTWNDGKSSRSRTDDFYRNIAAPFFERCEAELDAVYFKIDDYVRLDPDRRGDARTLAALYKILSPVYLLKQTVANDSNTLNSDFYRELLHILGLNEVEEKSGGKRRVIQRVEEGEERQTGAVIENTILQLRAKLPELGDERYAEFGDDKEEQCFNIALELALTWINRILFLKLLESQLLRFHGGDRKYHFVNTQTLGEYDDVQELFSQVLNCPRADRDEDLRARYDHIPYLNSSLFHVSKLESDTITIGSLNDKREIKLYGRTVLRDGKDKRRSGTMRTLAYLLEFLDAYDFATENEGEVLKRPKSLISATVLGLIFEKINGYREGAVYTPGFITMFMARESLRLCVLHRFNETYDWHCKDLEQLRDHMLRQDIDAADANKLVDDIKICDPAVGSGHFLVSVLNELIAVKSELRILCDEEGRPLPIQCTVINDELAVDWRDTQDNFVYGVNSKGGKRGVDNDVQRVQTALFNNKRRAIENSLFGVDINSNSANICRLRLWIELLKHAYYIPADNYGDLEVLPNIDINIKVGNSIISRFDLDEPLATMASASIKQIELYLTYVETYKSSRDWIAKHKLLEQIEGIKQAFSNFLSQNDPDLARYRKAAAQLYDLELAEDGLFNSDKKDAKKDEKREAKIAKLRLQVAELKEKVEEKRSGKLLHKSFEWRYEFPELLDATYTFKGFDLILANPPYIRQEEIREIKPLLKERYESYSGTADIFVYFFERAVDLLRTGGVMAFITANKYMRAGYGEKIREFLSEQVQIDRLIDFGDAQVFEEATAYPSILIAEKIPPDADHDILAHNWSATSDLKQAHKILRDEHFNLPQSSLRGDGWRLESRESLALLDKLRSKGRPLGELVQGKMYRGILTGFNEAFVIDAATRQALIDEDASAAEIIKPWLRGRDVKRWRVEYSGLYIIFTRRGIDIDAYPSVKRHLEQYKQRLTPGIKGGRKPGSYKWYELQDAIDYWQEFEKPKIIYPDIAHKCEFSISTDSEYCDCTIFLIPDHSYYLAALLNSNLIQYLIPKITPTIRGGYMRFKTIYLCQLPVVSSDPAMQIRIELLAKEIEKSPGESTELETQLNAEVYKLYDLTPAEIKLIESEISA